MADTRFAAAQAVAREAGRIMRRRFEDRASFTPSFKGHQDYLSEVNSEIERFILGRLGEMFPGDGFIGEEGGGAASDSLWVIDPIDGTANFVRGIPHFCVSIAYLRDLVPTHGVIFDPMMDELFAATAGGGASLDGVPIKVSGTADIRAATVEIGWNTRSGFASFLDLAGKVMGLGAGILRSGSGALGMAYVATGRTDAYLETHINSWDVLAGLLLVKEAGGVANDFMAGEGLTRGNPILAATPAFGGLLAGTSGIALAG